MDHKESLIPLCYNDVGSLKPKNECRASMINHLILEIGMGVDEAEDAADKTLRESGFWPEPQFEWDEEEEGGENQEKNIP